MQKKDFREEKSKGKTNKIKGKIESYGKKGNKSYSWTDSIH